MKPATKWFIAIVGLLAINVVAAIVLTVAANDRDRSQILPSYKTEAK